jgi:outer membrane receptor protein involved in Fe transport
MKKNISLLLLLACAFSANAAEKYKITGTINEAENKTPLFGASVKIIKAKDSTAIAGDKCDRKGKFQINAEIQDSALVKISMIGYQDLYKKLQYPPKSEDLGEIVLYTEAKVTDEVVVSAAKDIIKMDVDKMTVNVEKMNLASGGTAVDVLKNVPSIKVDIDNNVTLRGNSNIKILLDGKPSGLSMADLLQQTPSENIEKIEIMTNPSAKFNPEGGAGIINIILKRKKPAGIAGSVNMNLGNNNRNSGSANLNFRGSNFNVYGGYNLYIYHMDGDNKVKRTILDSTVEIPHTTQNGEFDRSYRGNSFNFGADYYFDDSNSLLFMVDYNMGKRRRGDSTLFKTFNRTLDPQRFYSRQNVSKYDNDNFDYSLTYKSVFELNKEELNIDLSFSPNNNNPFEQYDEKDYSTIDLSPNGIRNKYRSETDEKSKHAYFSLNYFNQFSQKRKIELGSNAFYRSNQQTYRYKNYNFEKSNWITDIGKSNDFQYDEYVGSFYATYMDAFGDFSFQLGARGEYTSTVGDQKSLKIKNENNYFSFFPSASLKYNFTEFIDVGISYSKRINRPWYHYVNPFVDYSDPLNWETGNPALKPEYSHSVQLSNSYIYDKGMLNLNTYYTYSNDGIEHIQRLLPGGITLEIPDNISEQQNFGAEAYGSYQLFDWWRLDASYSYFATKNSKSTQQQFSMDALTHGWYANISADLRLFDLVNVQTNTYYNSPVKYGQYESKEYLSTNISLRTDFKLFGNTASVSFSINDVFKSTNYGGITRTKQIIIETDRKRLSQFMNLGFSYRFNDYKSVKKGGSGGGEGGGKD